VLHVCYPQAYLRSHWPAEFLCARLADWGGFHHLAIYMAEATRLGIVVRPPHVNRSQELFTLTYKQANGKTTPTLWMGLGQVRDLRRDSIERLVRERQSRPFAGLGDVLQRVPLQTKEIQYLVQCGALDGLGSSRAALLMEAKQVRRAGGSGQLAFAFAQPETPPESAAQWLAWEQRILGWPVSVHPLELVAGLGELGQAGVIPLLSLPESKGKVVTVAGVRLPGWTGGPGFFLGDSQTFVVARGSREQKTPPPWQPQLCRGRWSSDEWGMSWLQIEQLQLLA
jgi:DNA polymerase III alpha subunit